MPLISKYFIAIVIIVLFSLRAYAEDNGWIPETMRPILKEYANGYKGSIGTEIIFANGESYNIDYLFRMQYLGRFQSNSTMPYLIFSAYTCDACDVTVSTHILKPENGILKEESVTQLPVPPGIFYAFGPDEKIISKSRMFCGECIDGYDQSAVWFINRQISPGNWEEAVYVADVEKGFLRTYYLVSPLPKIDETLSFVKDGQCREVFGQTITEGP